MISSLFKKYNNLLNTFIAFYFFTKCYNITVFLKLQVIFYPVSAPSSAV